MAQFNIRISDQVKRELKSAAALNGKNLQTWAADILIRHLAEDRASRDARRIAELEAEIAKLKAPQKTP
jgi:hypothetical protein